MTPVEQAPIKYDVESFGCMPISDLAGSYGRFILCLLVILVSRVSNC